MTQPQSSPFRRVALIATGLFLMCGIAMLVDVEITKHRRSDYIPGDLRRIVQLCEIFAHGFGIALVLYVVWVVAPDKRKLLPRLAACAIVPGLVVQVCKLFVIRYRPAHFFPEYAQTLSETWIGVVAPGQLNFEYVTQSFPSAHAATAVGLATGMIWLLPSCRNLFISLAFLASFQRIVAGAHWLSDVFAGAAVSAMVCGVIFYNRRVNSVFAKLENSDNQSANVKGQFKVAEQPASESAKAA